MYYILVRDANIEGHCVQTYFCKNQSEKEMFVICGNDVAYRFESTSDASATLERVSIEKGWLKHNMKILAVSTLATMVMPL